MPARKLQSYAVHEGDARADREADQALDLIADFLAELLISEARAELAAELGVSADELDREADATEREDLPKSVLELAPFPMEDGP